MNRRHFIKLGGVTWGMLGLNLFTPLGGRSSLWAGNPANDKKLILIFQRGGNDGINTVIPRGDSDYSLQTRPTLFIPEADAIDSGNGFAQFHPRLQPMMEIYNHSGINGRSGPGNLAVIHRVGYANQSRSHFDSQQYWENGAPGDSDLHEGILYRLINQKYDLQDKANAFVAAGLSSSQLTSFMGKNPLPNFRRSGEFTFRGGQQKSARLLGSLPTNEAGTNGSGLLGLYGGPADREGKRYRSLVHGTGELLGATMETLRQATAQGAYNPSNGAVYPNNTFGARLGEAAMLMKRTPVRFIGLNLGGWDNHQGQGQINGTQGNLLSYLAEGFQALYRDLQDQWDNLVILTMTEFGRTSMENGSRGTDHAESSVMFLSGGGVQGGVYNCDPSSWEPGAMFSRRDRYLSRRSDFRSVLGEVFTGHFGLDPSELDAIIPGYNFAAEDNPASFTPLNLFPR